MVLDMNINNKKIKPTLMFNGNAIKQITVNNNDILRTNYYLTDIKNVLSFAARRIINVTDNTTANSYSIVSYDTIVDETNKIITIKNLSIASTFFVSTSGTKTIEINLSVVNEFINVNGQFELVFINELYLSHGENSSAPLLIDKDLKITFLDNNKFYDVVELLTNWVK